MATVKKRGDSYIITVSCGYDATGKQIRRYYTYTPEPNMTDRQAQKELQRQTVLFEERCRNGEAADGKMKLADYIPIYFENAKHRLSPTVLEKYRYMIDKCILPLLGHMKMREIKPLHIQRFINALESRETHFDGTPGKLSSGTIRRYYTMLQSIFHSAYKLGVIGTNPADSDRVTLPKMEEQKTEIFTQEEIALLFSCLEQEPLQFKLLIHLAICTGCRRGELVGLQWGDIDRKDGTITICRSNYKVKGQPIQSKETKSGKSRKIALPDYCFVMLQQYHTEQIYKRWEVGDQWQDGDWIFTQWDGSPMYPTTPTLQFSRFLERHGLPHKKFHALRHTSATLLLSNGTNIKNVASRLGHAQIKTTNRYVHAVEAADRQAAETFEAIFHTDLKVKKQA